MFLGCFGGCGVFEVNFAPHGEGHHQHGDEQQGEDHPVEHVGGEPPVELPLGHDAPLAGLRGEAHLDVGGVLGGQVRHLGSREVEVT